MTKTTGKLKQLGITDISDVALYMPTDFVDYRNPVTNFDASKLHSGCDYTFKCTLYSEPNTKFKQGRPQTTFSVTDGCYILHFTLFGDTRSIIEDIKLKSHFYVSGTLSCGQLGYFINNALIIDENCVGSVIAIYPGLPGKLNSATVSKLITKLVTQSIPCAADKLRALLNNRFSSASELRMFLQCRKLTLIEVLNAIHLPTCVSSAQEALQVMQRVALISAADTLIEKALTANKGRVGAPIYGSDLFQLTRNVPFQITQEQRDIVSRQIDSLKAGILLNLLLIGDVGTGKTVVYGLIAGYIGSAGGRVCIMLPNGRLAEQIHTELSHYFPDLKPLLINTDSKHSETEMHSNKMLIGTSALLFRSVGSFELVVIDEQQKMSSSQRQQLVGVNTSVIEVSATPIPRTLALAQYGAVKIEYITQCHVEKTIDTLILEEHHTDYLNQLVIDTVRKGQKVLIVCPKRDGSNDDKDLPDAESVASFFNTLLPGAVGLAHSGLSEDENSKAISDIKLGITSVLVSTVIVEVGITIPNLTVAVVIRAERFGMTQLHQIRGRLVRQGGQGTFALYLPKKLKSERSFERMQALCEISCGYELARRDLKLRGVGDLAEGATQHGAYHGHVRNLHVDIDELEAVVNHFAINH